MRAAAIGGLAVYNPDRSVRVSFRGTGATGAAVAYVLAGGDPPVTVVLDGGELEVDVGKDLHVDLSGWAAPVFRGVLAEEFVRELHETK